MLRRFLGLFGLQRIKDAQSTTDGTQATVQLSADAAVNDSQPVKTENGIKTEENPQQPDAGGLKREGTTPAMPAVPPGISPQPNMGLPPFPLNALQYSPYAWSGVSYPPPPFPYPPPANFAPPLFSPYPAAYPPQLPANYPPILPSRAAALIPPPAPAISARHSGPGTHTLETIVESEEETNATSDEGGSASSSEASAANHPVKSPDWPDGYERRVHPVEASGAELKTRNAAWKRVKWAMRSVGKTDHRNHRAERRNCLGVYCCTNCNLFIRPKTQVYARSAQLAGACPNRRCRSEGEIEAIECEAFTLQWQEEIDGKVVDIWEHHGKHTHARPPGGATLSQREEEALDSQVSRRPDATAHQLRVGTTAPGSVPLGQIAPTLANSRKARYELQKSQERQDIIPSSSGSKQSDGGFIAKLAKLERNKLEPGFIIDSRISHPASYLSMQSPFMKLIIKESVDDWIRTSSEGPGAGRHGFVTDGDHSFFRTGTLLATCAFSISMNTWVPVLYTWVLHLDTDHHRAHFRNLNRSIIEAAGDHFDKKLLTNIFDFSMSQRAAHELEYADAVISTLPAWSLLSSEAQEAERKSLIAEAQAFEMGCDTHFLRSTKRLKQDTSLVPIDIRDKYQEFIDEFRSPDYSRAEFLAIVSDFKLMFPALQKWMKWWMHDKIASMTFPAMRQMDEKLANDIPHTSNPIEALHSLLHHALGTNHDVIAGVEKLGKFIQELQTKSTAIDDGHFPASNRINTTRPVHRQSYKRGDGRPPDTADELLPSATAASPTLQLQSTNATPTITTQPNSEFNVVASAASRKQVLQRFSNGNFTDRAQLRQLQSYPFYNNSCFIDCGLELWFRAYVTWLPVDRSAFLDIAVPKTSTLWAVFNSFQSRLLWILAPSMAAVKTTDRETVYQANTAKTKGKQKDIWPQLEDNIEEGLDVLRCSQNIVRHALAGRLAMYPEGSFGNVLRWMSEVVMDDTNTTTQQNFCIEHYVTFTCTEGHRGGGIATRSVFYLAPHPRDVMRAGDASNSDDVDIGSYLTHLSACSFTGVRSYNHGNKLFDLPDRSCGHDSCDKVARVFTVQTAWPAILHIVPETCGETADAFEERTRLDFSPHPTRLPLRFHIQTKSNHAPDQLAEGELRSSPVVEYEMVGRLLFDADKLHFTAEVIIGDSTYEYNDMERNGVMMRTGPAVSIEELSHKVSLVVYRRVSEGKITEQDREYYESSPKERWKPHHSASLSIDDDGHVHVENHPTQAQGVQVSNNSLSPPEDHTSHSTSSDDLPIALALANTQCVGCLGTEEEGTMVQCDQCRTWSHTECIEEHFTLSPTYQDPDEAWICPRCMKIPVWSESMIGQTILFPTTRFKSAKVYPARIIGRRGKLADIEWYHGNTYRKRERPNFHTIPIHTCAASLDMQRKRGDIAKYAALAWPTRLIENAVDKYGYSNVNLTHALEDAFYSVWEIISGKRLHPVVQRYKDEMPKGVERPQWTTQFHDRYRIPILEGDDGLIDHYLAELQARLKQEMPKVDEGDVHSLSIDSRIHGIALMLLRLVILREYLERKPEDDDEIYRLIVSAADEERAQHTTTKNRDEPSTTSDKTDEAIDTQEYLVRTQNSIKEIMASLESDGDDAPVRAAICIVRKPTISEQALAALMGWSDTTSLDNPHALYPLNPSYLQQPNTIMVRDDLDVLYDHPLAYVHTPGYPTPYLWPQSNSPGLTGGPPYKKPQKQELDGSERKPTLRPRPKPVPKEEAAQDGGDLPAKRKKRKRSDHDENGAVEKMVKRRKV
ncbi:hypothetical protein NM688_g4086 [Phlebia brevispora]|uniref:Uncharacterized protein n=1 Tax=Phlebia brevispora TaxID=194682 RepID=A0ACC1T4J7_9APHY|nr:hypothetical protein NM688_g4086 [Phlebia brevispora]